jgi:predicted lipoprotein
MAIVSSTYEVGHAQADGRRYVVELHTDSAGTVHRVEYGPMADGTDYAAIMTARAAQISQQLADQEAESLWL